MYVHQIENFLASALISTTKDKILRMHRPTPSSQSRRTILSSHRFPTVRRRLRLSIGRNLREFQEVTQEHNPSATTRRAAIKRPGRTPSRRAGSPSSKIA